MTRRLKPPAPVTVRVRPDGMPCQLSRGGRVHTITRIAATWVQPAPWWSEETDVVDDPRRGERTYYRVVVDGIAAFEIFAVQEGRRWYLSRIID